MNNNKTIVELKKIIPELTTRNLTFRLMQNSDLYCLFNSSQHEDFNKNLGWGPPKDQDELINYFYDKKFHIIQHMIQKYKQLKINGAIKHYQILQKYFKK